jgi:hypothetical protein
MTGSDLVRAENFALVQQLEDSGALTPTRLDLSSHPDLSYEQCESLASFLGHLHNSSKWWIYDLLIQIEMRYGDLVYQASEATGLSEQTIMNGMNIATKIPSSRRRPGVRFSTHAVVAALEPDDQKRWLKIAEDEGLKRNELRERIQAEKDDGDILDPPELCPSCGRPL